VKYHPHVSPRSLVTNAADVLSGYPARWELMRWYLCWRKFPYASEVIAALIVEDRAEGYSHYPCPLDPSHWHIGRGGGGNSSNKRYAQAKRVYRRAVRDEIWRDHVVRQEQERRGGESRERTPALAD
jgi:hypothetical protein